MGEDASGLACDSYCAIEVKRPEKVGCCARCCVALKRLHWYLLACFCNLLLSPLVLVWHAFRIYMLPCCLVYLGRFCGGACRLLCCECIWRYTDSAFPPNSDSLGPTEKKFTPGVRDTSCCCPSLFETGGDVQWLRSEDLFNGKKGKLFSGGITPSDIAQGQLGNCWLLAAIATLAEREGVVESCFVSHDYSPRGKYELTLYDPIQGGRRNIVVDDTLPCDKNGKPLFTQPNGEELWVLLLEKAFAKYMGNYAALEGGLPVWAMHVMTGDESLHWSFDGSAWKASELRAKQENGQIRPAFYGTGEKISSERMFQLVCEYADGGCALGAGTKGKDETISQGRGSGGGIVPGHAYSILDCRKIFEFKLIKLRNPWGSFEWSGDWSDNSEKWNAHPAVKSALQGEPQTGQAKGDDGTFCNHHSS